MAQIIHVGSGSGKLRANVIFLHGLGGDPRGTWRNGPDDQSFWPQWLVDDIKGLGVYSMGYESPVSRWHGTAMHLTDRANNVLERILAEHSLQKGQLILIGHSLGGLIIKQLLRTAESKSRYSADAANLFQRVEKVAFLATPHSGADLARWGDHLRIAIRPSAATTCLVRNDANLRDLNLWYRDWANERRMSHLTLVETDSISILGMVVKPDSGDAGLANCRPVSINADHFTICKPVDRNHDTYVFVRNFIETPFERPKTAVEKQFAALNAKMDRLVAAHAESGETSNAEKAGVSQGVIIQLAQRIDAGVDDFDQAMVELERAVAVAVEVVEEGRRGSNTGDFVDVVLKRIAERSAKGQFDEAAVEADAGFAQWEREEAERRDAAVAGGLKLLDAGLKQDILRRDPVSAAKRIARMVALEYPDDPAARLETLRTRQNEWFERGRDKGLNFDLSVSIEVARVLLVLDEGTDRVVTLVNLGLALRTLGERSSDTAHLDEAVDAFHIALQECSRESDPLLWAVAQDGLGNALLARSRGESGTVRVKEAVAALQAALEERTRERLPSEWAMTQNNLGNAFLKLAEHESDTIYLDEAVKAYRAALKETARERVPLDWATMKNNLGNALTRLGERECGTAYLDEAVDAYRAALEETAREHVPLDWAMLQNNLGIALSNLGERQNGTARFHEAIDAFHAALQEWTREGSPLEWGTAKDNLGSALLALGERESGTARLEEAVKAYSEALGERTRERVPRDWAATQTNLGDALRALGERGTGTAYLDQARDAHYAALQEFTRERDPFAWATAQNNLGNALLRLGERQNSTPHLEQAIAAFHAALEERTRDRGPFHWAMTQNDLGIALTALGERESGTTHLKEAIVAFHAALEERTQNRVPRLHGKTQQNLARAAEILERREN
jgi:tetratricopeptide (TPR) repeat protein/pimeloyl-ACP methyl ester carboxylesterase